MEFQIPRQTWIYLLASLSFILMPHIPRSYVALPIIWAVATFWQMRVYQQAWQYPNTMIKVLLIGAGIFAVWFQYRSFVSLEFVTQMLIMALLLKLLEMKQKRDVLLIIYLSYFSVLTQLLFSQNIVSSLYVVVAFILITACLVSLNQANEVGRWHALQLALKMFLVSLPLMITAFLVFPRIDPLWSIPNFSKSAKTGLSGRMSPGDFTNLQQSNTLVMRVKFDGEVPASSKLYWRAIVLENFNGREWFPRANYQYRSLSKEQLNALSTSSSDQRIYYEITQEASYTSWMFSLDELMTTSLGEYFETRVIGNKKPITERIQYQLSSDLNRSGLKTQSLSKSLRRLNTFLPSGFNPRATSFAQDLYLYSKNDRDFANQLLNHIITKNFYYTHQPPLLGKHSVDEFWFDEQSGLCEHYSQAMAVMFRSVGIPARVVTGLQGGTINPFEDYLMVRERDAHAWVEAWIDDEGWQRFDPTFAVDPSRILSNDFTNDLLNLDSDELGAEAAGRSWNQQRLGFSTIQKIQFKLDQLNYAWQRQVMNFDSSRQIDVLNQLLGRASYLRMALFITLIFVSVFVIFQAYQYLSVGRFKKILMSEESKLYQNMLKRLSKAGVVIDDSEPPLTLLKRLESEGTLRPEQLTSIAKIIQIYNQLQYSPKQAQQRQALLNKLKSEVSSIPS